MPAVFYDLQQYRISINCDSYGQRRLVVGVTDESDDGIVSFIDHIISTSRHGRASGAHRHAGYFIVVSFSPYYLKESSLEEVVRRGTIR